MMQERGITATRLVPRVLVVDDHAEWRQAHERNLRRWGYEVYVAQGVGQALLDDALRQAQQYQCHVALVDMCLLDDYGYDKSGLGLVQQLLPTLSIMVSAFGTPAIATEAITERGAAGFVGKQEKPQQLRDVVQKVMARYCLVPDTVNVVWTTTPSHLKQTGSFADDGQWSLQEVEEVLRRLFPKVRQLQVEPLVTGEPLTQQAPRLRGLVLKVWQDDLQPVFVKVARAERIRGEVEKCGTFIRGRLKGNHYARLVDHKLLWNLGAVCYELLDVQLVGVRPFSRFFVEASSLDVILQALQAFFEQTWSVHYAQPKCIEARLAETYGTVWGHDLQERLGRYVEEERPLILLSPAALMPNPLRWVHDRLAHEPRRTLPIAVTHGDLHADNMMVDINGRICVIDYERTGWGPVYQDFIELETDMLVRLTAVDTPKPLELYKLFLNLTRPAALSEQLPALDDTASVAARKTWLVIRHLRQLAHTVTGVDDMEQYLWGLLLNAVFRATLLRRMMPDGSHNHNAEYQRALLWGSVICQRLEELEQEA
ncbi:MAG: phosphotransferase [Anaerolineales bacterium]|nr:phosphotransferase [Anaerolineales bacterium]